MSNKPNHQIKFYRLNEGQMTLVTEKTALPNGDEQVSRRYEPVEAPSDHVECPGLQGADYKMFVHWPEDASDTGEMPLSAFNDVKDKLPFEVSLQGTYTKDRNISQPTAIVKRVPAEPATTGKKKDSKETTDSE